jgi:hypothetical protein
MQACLNYYPEIGDFFIRVSNKPVYPSSLRVKTMTLMKEKAAVTGS